MLTNPKWQLSTKTKKELIDALTPELAALRTKANISQSELANLIGVSRQTYGAIERQSRRMTWNTYLSLIMFYDYNQKTHQMIRAIGAFPESIIQHFNEGEAADVDVLASLGEDMKPLLDCLDEQALHSIRTMIMVEYARCAKLPGDVVVKSFDGKLFAQDVPPDTAARKAFAAIKNRR